MSNKTTMAARIQWIEENAYFRWLNEGRHHGHHERHWHEAEMAFDSLMTTTFYRVLEDIPNDDGTVNKNSTRRLWGRKEWLATHKACPKKWIDKWNAGNRTIESFTTD